MLDDIFFRRKDEILKMGFTTEIRSEQWIVDKLSQHECCENVFIEKLDDEVMLCCENCQEIIINFFRKGVFE